MSPEKMKETEIELQKLATVGNAVDALVVAATANNVTPHELMGIVITMAERKFKKVITVLVLFASTLVWSCTSKINQPQFSPIDNNYLNAERQADSADFKSRMDAHQFIDSIEPHANGCVTFAMI
jgi:hypothetical protein